MAQNKSGNDPLLRVRSQRLEGLLDLYSRGVIQLDDFIRLKDEVKSLPFARSTEPAEPSPSGSNRRMELRQIRDEIHRRERAIEPGIEPQRKIDLSPYLTPPPKVSPEPRRSEDRATETSITIPPELRIGSAQAEEAIEEVYVEPDALSFSSWRIQSAEFLSSSRSVRALSATFFLAIILTIGIARSGPVNEIVSSLQPQNSTASSFVSSVQANSHIHPRFGPQAVRQCLDWCGGMNSEDLCSRACNRLTLSEFARRITKSEIDPAQEAKASTQQCAEQAHRRLPESDRSAWTKSTNELVETLRHAEETRTISDFSRARLDHDKLNQLNESVSAPQQASLSEKTLSSELARASCLRVNLALSEMGLVLARQSSDSLSERFYQRYYEQLQPAAASASRNISDLLKKIGDFDGAQTK